QLHARPRARRAEADPVAVLQDVARADPLAVYVRAGGAADVGEEQAARGVPPHPGVDGIDVVRLEAQVGIGAGAQDLLRAGGLEGRQGAVARGPGDDQRGVRRVLEGVSQPHPREATKWPDSNEERADSSTVLRRVSTTVATRVRKAGEDRAGAVR